MQNKETIERIFEAELQRGTPYYGTGSRELIKQASVDYGLYPVPDIKNYKVHCAICGKPLKVISHTHLKSHNLTTKEYQEQYGPLSFISQVEDKMLDLYHPHFFKWREQTKQGFIEKQYNQIYTNKDGDEFQIKEVLNLKSHLSGSKTIGIFPSDYNKSTFMVFDVDMGIDRTQYTLALVEELTNYVQRENIYVSYSGSKGYHVELFFSKPVFISRIKQFGKSILRRIDAFDKIEVMPTPSKRNIKLPLGFHRGTGNFCCMVDNDNLDMLPNQYYSFLEIDKVDPEIIDMIDYKSERRIKETEKKKGKELPERTQRAKDCERIYKYGLDEVGTRHEWAFKMALWMRDELGYEKEKAKKLLYAWTVKQFQRGMLNDSLQKVIKDMEYILVDIFDKGKYIFGYYSKEISFSEEDIKFILSLPQKKEAYKILLLALLVWCYCWPITSSNRRC